MGPENFLKIWKKKKKSTHTLHSLILEIIKLLFTLLQLKDTIISAIFKLSVHNMARFLRKVIAIFIKAEIKLLFWYD